MKFGHLTTILLGMNGLRTRATSGVHTVHPAKPLKQRIELVLNVEHTPSRRRLPDDSLTANAPMMGAQAERATAIERGAGKRIERFCRGAASASATQMPRERSLRKSGKLPELCNDTTFDIPRDVNDATFTLSTPRKHQDPRVFRLFRQILLLEGCKQV